MIWDDILDEGRAAPQEPFVAGTVFQYMSQRHSAPSPPPTPPPWQRTPHRNATRRREPITAETIVDAAVRVLDSDGLDAFSMRRVAEELDTGAASLYWHVGSKDGLLDLLFDRVIGEISVPRPRPKRWQAQLEDVARAMRTTILRHPDILRVSVGRIPMGPNALRFSEQVTAILRAGGVPDRLAVLGQHLLIAAVNGFTLDEVGAPQAGDNAVAPEQGAAMLRDYLTSLPAEQFPNLIAVADYFTITDADERFDLLIELFVDGLAKRAAAERGA